MSIVNKVKIKNSDGTYTTADIGASAANIQMSDGNSLQTDYNTLNTGKAPTNHGTSTQSTAATYGLASSSVYGHMKVGTGLSASDGTVSVSYGTSATTACVGNDSRLSNARTPVAHASSETTYGVGTDSAYGHVMVTNNFVRTNQSGYALSAYGANRLANSIASIIDKNIGDKPDSQIAAGTFFYTKDNILRRATVDISTTTALSTTNAPAASQITTQISNISSKVSNLDGKYKTMVIGLYTSDTPIPLASPSALIKCPNILHSGSASYLNKTSDGGIRCLKGGVIVVYGFINITGLNTNDDIGVYCINYNNGTTFDNSVFRFTAGQISVSGAMFWVIFCNANDIIYLRAYNNTSATRGSVTQARLMVEYLEEN